MAIVTATEVTQYTDISASAGTIATSGYIEIVQERINQICNNWFLSDMYLNSTLTFDASAGTMVATASWEDEGFVAGDEVYIYGAYRNDGYKLVGTVSGTTLTLASGYSVVSEPSGRSILVSVVQWPNALKYLAAQMVKYDYDDRAEAVPGVASKTLGPYSISYRGASSSGDNSGAFGYPRDLVDALAPWTIARLN